MPRTKVNHFIGIPNLKEEIPAFLTKMNISTRKVFCDEKGTCSYKIGEKSGLEYGHHYYLAQGILANKSEEPIVVKIRIDKPTSPDDIFYRDKNFDIERKFYRFGQNRTKLVPRLVDYGQTGELKWLIYEFANGLSLGPTFLVSQSTEKEYAKLLANALSRLAKTPLPKRFALTLRDGNSHLERLMAILESNAETIDRYISADNQKKIITLGKRLIPTLDQSATYLCHGDLHPGNIIVHHKKTVFIDWETVHQDNYMFDASLLWLRLWNVPWRDKMMSIFLENFPQKEAEQIFQYMTLRHLIGEIVFWDRVIRENNLSFIEHAQKALQSHQETLKKALAGKPLISWPK